MLNLAVSMVTTLVSKRTTINVAEPDHLLDLT